ncbi:MAG: hypothetical protein ACOYN0_06015 [Phycisphaerales bacterium]
MTNGTARTRRRERWEELSALIALVRRVTLVVVAVSLLSSARWVVWGNRLQNLENPHWYFGMLVNALLVVLIAVVWARGRSARSLPWLLCATSAGVVKVLADTEAGQVVLSAIPPLPLCFDPPIVALSGVAGWVAGVIHLRGVVRWR